MSTADCQVSAARSSIETRSEIQYTSSGEAASPILLLARTGFAIRNLLLGTFADEILQHRHLVVAVPDPEDPALRSVIEDRNITSVPFIEAPDNPQYTRLQLLRRFHTYMYRFREAEKRTASLAIQSRLFQSRHSPMGTVLHRLLRGIGRLAVAANLMGLIEKSYLATYSSKAVAAEWMKILERWKPAVVVSTMLTHSTLRMESCDLVPVLVAKQLGIPVGTLVQSWDNLSSKTAVLPPWLVKYWVWSDYMGSELLDLNPRVPREQVSIVGGPQFDFHKDPNLLRSREEFLNSLGLDPARPVILIGTGTSVWLPNEPQTVVELTEAIERSLSACQILIRLHPKDNMIRWTKFRARIEDTGAVLQTTAPPIHMDLGGFVPPKDFYRDQVNSLAHSAVVINTASTLTVDAAILDRPVISIGWDAGPDPKFPEGRAWAYNHSTHFGALVATGGVKLVRSCRECLASIAQYLENPNMDQMERAQIVSTVVGTVDGMAGRRLADEVLLVASSTAAVTSD